MSTSLALGAADGLALAAFEVSTARSFADIHGLKDTLQQAEAASDFYSTWAWFENLSSAGIEPDVQRLLITVRNRQNGSVFCLPLLVRQHAPAAVFGPVVASLSNYYSSLYGPIGDLRQLSVPALRAAIRHLRQHHRPCAVMDLRPLDAAGPFHALMLAALHAEGYFTDSYFCFGNWHLDVAGRSYAAYEPGVPSRLRNTIQRGRKKLHAAGPWTLQIHASPGAELDQAISDFEAIYAKSWKVPEPFPGFVPGLCRTAAAKGWLRLGVIRFEERPIAAQLWLVKDGHALIYKLAYDEDYKRFSAGSVLSAEMMRRAIDDERVVDVDYLTGDDGYKVDWMSHRRERVGLLAFEKTSLAGNLSWARHSAGKLRARWQSRRAGQPAAAPRPDTAPPVPERQA